MSCSSAASFGGSSCPPGPTGPAGPQGPQGPQGPPGPAATCENPFAFRLDKAQQILPNPSGAPVLVTWSAILFSTNAAAGINLAAETYTVQRAGLYDVHIHVDVTGQNLVAQNVELRFLSGVTILAAQQVLVGANTRQSLEIDVHVSAGLGDVWTVQINMPNGGTLHASPNSWWSATEIGGVCDSVVFDVN